MLTGEYSLLSKIDVVCEDIPVLAPYGVFHSIESLVSYHRANPIGATVHVRPRRETPGLVVSTSSDLCHLSCQPTLAVASRTPRKTEGAWLVRGMSGWHALWNTDSTIRATATRHPSIRLNTFSVAGDNTTSALPCSLRPDGGALLVPKSIQIETSVLVVATNGRTEGSSRCR